MEPFYQISYEVSYIIAIPSADKALYGLNITNSIISSNIGNGILGIDLRDRTALHNVTVEDNQGQVGIYLLFEKQASITKFRG